MAIVRIMTVPLFMILFRHFHSGTQPGRWCGVFQDARENHPSTEASPAIWPQPLQAAGAAVLLLRHSAGGSPIIFLNARLKAASDS
jgi:hypothetical protein